MQTPVLPKIKSCNANLEVKSFSVGKKRDFSSRMRKCGPDSGLSRTSSCYSHQYAAKSLKSTFCYKSVMLFIMEGLLYDTISKDMNRGLSRQFLGQISAHNLSKILNIYQKSGQNTQKSVYSRQKRANAT